MKLIRSLGIMASAVVSLSLMTGSAKAQGVDTSNVAVAAEVVQGCLISSPPTVADFGQISPFVPTGSAFFSMEVSCPNGTNYEIGIGGGGQPSGGNPQLLCDFSGDFTDPFCVLEYQFFHILTPVAPVGDTGDGILPDLINDGTNAGSPVDAVGIGGPESQDFEVRLVNPVSTNHYEGFYTDIAQVTVAF